MPALGIVRFRRSQVAKAVALVFVFLSFLNQKAFAATDWTAIQTALSASGVEMPGDVLRRDPGMELDVFVSWVSHYALDRVEVVWNGKAVAGKEYPEGSNRGQFSTCVTAPSDGWLAARVFSRNFDSFYQPIYAHTGPVYVLTGIRSPEHREAAGRFATAIDSAREKINRGEMEYSRVANSLLK